MKEQPCFFGDKEMFRKWEMDDVRSAFNRPGSQMSLRDVLHGGLSLARETPPFSFLHSSQQSSNYHKRTNKSSTASSLGHSTKNNSQFSHRILNLSKVIALLSLKDESIMTGSNSYRPRHSHPINGLSLIPQHVLNSNRNTPSPRLSRPAIDPYKALLLMISTVLWIVSQVKLGTLSWVTTHLPKISNHLNLRQTLKIYSSQISSNDHSASSNDEDSDEDEDSESDDAEIDSEEPDGSNVSDLGSVSQDLDAHTASFLNNHNIPPLTQEGIIPVDEVDDGPENSDGGSSDSSSIVFQPQQSHPRRPFSPGIESLQNGGENYENVDIDDMHESEEDEDEVGGNDDDVNEHGDERNDRDAAADLDFDGDGIDNDGVFADIDLIADDILVTKSFTSLHQKIEVFDQNIHPAFQPITSDVVRQDVEHDHIRPALLGQPSGSHALSFPSTEERKLSRTGSYSADGAMIFRPSSESSLNLDSEDHVPEESLEFDKAQATGDVDGSPIIDHDPRVLNQPPESPSRAINQFQTSPRIPNQHQLQFSSVPETHRAHSELIQDDDFLPISFAPEPPPGPSLIHVGNQLSADDMCLEQKVASQDLEGVSQIVSPVLDLQEGPPASNITDTELENRQEDQVEDDTDLFEGDEDVRLHRLGLNKSRFRDVNQNEEGSLPNIAPPAEAEIESEDRFTSIEKQLESYFARTDVSQCPQVKDCIEDVDHELHHISSDCNITTEPAAVPTEVSQPSETDSHVLDNAAQPVAVQDAQLFIESAETPQQAAVVPSSEKTQDATAEITQSNTSPPDQEDSTRPSLDVLWGELSPTNGVNQVTDGSRMNEVNFFPLKQSDSEIFNAASWTPALSTNISPSLDHATTQLFGSTDMKYSIVSLTLPQRPNLRQSVNLDECPKLSVPAPHGGTTELNLPSKNDPQHLSSSHDQEDYDMLASSFTDGNSDIAAPGHHENTDPPCIKDTEVVSVENLKPHLADNGHEDEKLQDEKPCSSKQSTQDELSAGPAQSFQPPLLPCDDPIGTPSSPKAADSTMDEADMMLSQFINCSPDEAESPRLDDQLAPASPTPIAAAVPAVTFAASPPMEMNPFERFDDQSVDVQLDIMLNVEQSVPAFEPQTPMTSTTGGQRTASEFSERHLSRGSVYSAPSSVISSDGASAPASVGPPPPLHNASMGAPTEAVGLSNQMTRRSSIGSSTNAEPPSPSTSTRHRSAPITQEQVNAPGLPHVEAAEVASSPSSGLPDPLRSPPPSIQQLIPIPPAEINPTVSRESSMRDTSPQFDPRLSLPDPIATPLPVSIPAIKLEDLPNECLSIERHPSLNSSAASQPATSPRFEKFSSSSIISTTIPTPDALIEQNVHAVDQLDNRDINSTPASPALNTSDIEATLLSPTRMTTPTPRNQASDASREENVQVVGESNTPGINASLASPTGKITTTPIDQPTASVSPRSSKAIDTGKRSEPSQEPSIAVSESQGRQSQSSESAKDGEISKQEDPSKILDPLTHDSSKIPTITSDAALPLIQDKAGMPHAEEDFIAAETAIHLQDGDENSTTNELKKPPLSVKQDLVANGEADTVLDDKRDAATNGHLTTDEVPNPSEVEEPAEAQSQLGPTTRNKSKRKSETKDPSGTARSREIEAEEKEEQDRESQLRNILRKRRASKQLTPQTVLEPEENKKQTQTDRTTPPIETKKKKIVVKRDTKASKGEGSSHPESTSTCRQEIIDGVKQPGSTGCNPKSFERHQPISIPCVPSSPLNNNLGEESSNSILGCEGDELSLVVRKRKLSRNSRSRRSSRNSDSPKSTILPTSTVSVMIPHPPAGDLIPGLRLHQHNSKNNSQQGSSTDHTESKPVIGVRAGRRKQSEGNEARQLPPSIPPVTRSHCHFIRLQFPPASGRIFDTFLVPQCATGNEEIKKKMKELKMIEVDNLTGEEQSRGIRIGADGSKQADERLELASSSSLYSNLKAEFSNFAVDEETLNILIDIFGLSLIQDGQVEVLLPKLYFSRFDHEQVHEEDEYDHHYQGGGVDSEEDPLRRLDRQRELSYSSFGSRNEVNSQTGGTASSRNSHTNNNNNNRHLKRRAQSPSSSMHSARVSSSPHSSSFLSPTERLPKHKRRPIPGGQLKKAAKHHDELDFLTTPNKTNRRQTGTPSTTSQSARTAGPSIQHAQQPPSSPALERTLEPAAIKLLPSTLVGTQSLKPSELRTTFLNQLERFKTVESLNLHPPAHHYLSMNNPIHMPMAEPATTSPKTLLSYLSNPPSPISLVVAWGPFTRDNDLDYIPFEALIDQLMIDQPDCLILDILVSQVVYPQSSIHIKDQELGLFGRNIVCLPDPTIIPINKIVIGINHVDVLMPLEKDEFVKKAEVVIDTDDEEQLENPNKNQDPNATNVISRACRHVMRQQR
ncbi:hypothetical protein KEM48_008104 [Puccinia striiformis f. sp. tritici PST-130]|nr:hypothetical protein KEM48_008104 [Puccinia striiformis f. sp. tritici PST-130]